MMLVFIVGARRMGHLGPSWAILETSGDYLDLGTIWGHFYPSWAHLGSILGCLRCSWDHLGTIWGPCWDHLRSSWAKGAGKPTWPQRKLISNPSVCFSCCCWTCLRQLWAIFGPFWCPLEVQMLVDNELAFIFEPWQCFTALCKIISRHCERFASRCCHWPESMTGFFWKIA